MLEKIIDKLNSFTMPVIVIFSIIMTTIEVYYIGEVESNEIIGLLIINALIPVFIISLFKNGDKGNE